MLIRPFAVAAMIAVLLPAFSGCTVEDPATVENVGTGTLRITMIDAPSMVEGLGSMPLTISAVRVHEVSEGGGWVDLMPDSLTAEERTFDLLELVDGVEVVLGETALEPGTYSQVRLVIEAASVVVDSVEYPLTIPSGMQSGLKLICGFTIEPGLTTTLTLDFDVQRSLIETPPGSRNFKLKPTLRLVAETDAGRVFGTVLPTGIGATVIAVAESTGDTVTTTGADPGTGGYMLGSLPEGLYTLTATAADHDDSITTGVEVFRMEDTGPVDFLLRSTDTPDSVLDEL